MCSCPRPTPLVKHQVKTDQNKLFLPVSDSPQENVRPTDPTNLFLPASHPCGKTFQAKLAHPICSCPRPTRLVIHKVKLTKSFRIHGSRPVVVSAIGTYSLLKLFKNIRLCHSIMYYLSDSTVCVEKQKRICDLYRAEYAGFQLWPLCG